MSGSTIASNGPAIWGGCVTRRKHRAGSRYPAPAGPESCHGARKVRRAFCRHGTNFIEHWRGRAVPRTAGRGYKFDRSREVIPGYKVSCGHLRSVAVQTISEPENCHDAGFKLLAEERVRVHELLRICLECRSKSKKCDKQLTHIVRVSCWGYFCFSIKYSPEGSICLTPVTVSFTTTNSNL